jgi:hypothetical protein
LMIFNMDLANWLSKMATTSKVSFVYSCSRLVMHVDRWISPKKGGQKDDL